MNRAKNKGYPALPLIDRPVHCIIAPRNDAAKGRRHRRECIWYMTKIRQFLSAFTPHRRLTYFIGILFLACGLTMNTKTQLGVSPVLSVAYNLAELLHISFGVMSFIYYVFLILVQLLLLRSEFDQIQWLQLLASFLTSAFISIYDYILPTAQTLPVRICMLVLAIVLTGIGIILTVGSKFVPNPADGTANAISTLSGWSLGFSKNVLDLVSILVALTLGLVFRHQILGVGIGTVITMVLTGRVVALLQKPVLKLAGLDKQA